MDDLDVGVIPMDVGRTIFARVIRADRQPAAGARVMVARDLGDGDQEISVGEEPEERTSKGEGLSTSAQDGRCALSGMRVGELLVVADHPERGRSPVVTIPAGTEDAAVVLALPRRGGSGGADRGRSP